MTLGTSTKKKGKKGVKKVMMPMQWHLGRDAIEKKQRSGQIIIKKAPDAE